MAGRPAKQSADKSQDEFLMQSPWGCWMLQRMHWVVVFFQCCLSHHSSPIFDVFLKFLKHSFLLQLYSLLCWAKEVWHFLKHPHWNSFPWYAWVVICFSGFYYEVVLAYVVTFSTNRSLFLLQLAENIKIQFVFTSLHLLLSISQLWSRLFAYFQRLFPLFSLISGSFFTIPRNVCCQHAL